MEQDFCTPKFLIEKRSLKWFILFNKSEPKSKQSPSGYGWYSGCTDPTISAPKLKIRYRIDADMSGVHTPNFRAF